MKGEHTQALKVALVQAAVPLEGLLLCRRLGCVDLSEGTWAEIENGVRCIREALQERQRGPGMINVTSEMIEAGRANLSDQLGGKDTANLGEVYSAMASARPTSLRERDVVLVREALLDTGKVIGASSWPDDIEADAEVLARAAIAALQAHAA